MTSRTQQTNGSPRSRPSASGAAVQNKSPDVEVRVVAHTDCGPRPKLEDAYSAWTLDNPLVPGRRTTVLTVCDGVGGQAGGDVASAVGVRLAPANLLAELLLAPKADDGEAESTMVEDALRRALARANDAVLAVAEQNAALQRMATTIVCAVIHDATLHVAWAGDSRCYRFGPSGLRRLTRDHRETEELIDARVLKPGEVDLGASAHVITRCLGHPGDFAADQVSVPLSPGDVVLLCTDGLTDALTDNDLAALLESCAQRGVDFADLPRELVQAALEAGTLDNATVLGCQYQPSRTTRCATRTEAYPSALAQTCANLEDLA